MASASSSVDFKIEVHPQNFAADQSCLICSETDIDTQIPKINDKLIKVIVSGPSVEPISDNELVHLSCHPDQPYHYKCLKQWLHNKPSCPLDRRQASSTPPTIKNPGIDNSSVTDVVVHSIALITMGSFDRFGGFKKELRE